MDNWTQFWIWFGRVFAVKSLSSNDCELPKTSASSALLLLKPFNNEKTKKKSLINWTETADINRSNVKLAFKWTSPLSSYILWLPAVDRSNQDVFETHKDTFEVSVVPRSINQSFRNKNTLFFVRLSSTLYFDQAYCHSSPKSTPLFFLIHTLSLHLLLTSLCLRLICIQNNLHNVLFENVCVCVDAYLCVCISHAVLACWMLCVRELLSPSVVTPANGLSGLTSKLVLCQFL